LAANRKKRQTDDAGDGSERLCAVTREALPPEALIRFALGPDGQIVPDLERRLPGRGVWVSCHQKTLEKAINTKAFSRSFKSQVNVDPDLPERIGVMMARRVLDALALANKAGRVVSGFQQVDGALEKGTVAVLLHGTAAAADGRQKLDRKFQAIQRERGARVPILDVLTIEQMSLAIGRPSVVHAALIPGGLTERFLREAERLSRYRAPSAASDQSLPVEQRTEG
jgi:uncharacterized protein